MSDTVLIAIDGPVATVTLNRPEVRNAFTLATWQRLAEVVEETANRREVRVLVIRGAGDKAFAAGADVHEFPEKRWTLPQSVAYGQAVERALTAVREARQPVIAMIRGFCVGGGCELASACDIRIASEDARVGITPAKIGLILGFEEVRHLTSIVGPGLAKELLFTGRLMDANEAKQARYLNHVVPVEELESFTRDFIASILQNAPITIEAAKRGVNASMPATEAHAVGEYLDLYVRGFSSGDYQEGVRAFHEKRKPAFTGG
ncbi:MAG: enoyl-CoA hydratase/isomerase family protein [Chloroflexi bacterium]|nr:enoyl-CoA hydratase/isomerase family protein [Chloroflexota bacterium]